MALTSYLPDSDNDLVAWFDNFSAKLPGYQTPFDLTAAEVTATRNDFLWLSYSVLQVDVFTNERSERVAYKILLKDGPVGAPTTPYPTTGTQILPAPPVVPPGIVPRIRALVKRIKAHKNYTPAAGEDLALIAPELVQPAVIKPPAAAAVLPNSEVKVTYTKGPFSGAIVECQRGGETGWTSLGLKLRSSAVDARPPLVPGQPELRKYRLRYQQGDEPVGEYSDVLTVTTMP